MHAHIIIILLDLHSQYSYCNMCVHTYVCSYTHNMNPHTMHKYIRTLYACIYEQITHNYYCMVQTYVARKIYGILNND